MNKDRFRSIIIINVALILVFSMISAVFADDNELPGDDFDHIHHITHITRIEPTDNKNGNIECWYCKGCGKYFSDANGTNEISKESTVIPMLSASKGSRKSNTMSISKASKTYKRSKLRSKKTYTIKVTKANGKVTYDIPSDTKNAKIKVKKVSYKTKGKGNSAQVTAQYRITVPKKCRKGTYTISFTAAGNGAFKKGTKTATIVVK